MSLKAGWVALFLFVYAIGIFLGSTFDYQSAEAESGQSYSTGIATFTNGSATVAGGGTTWVGAMEDGNIRADADGIWCKILSVDGIAQLTLYAPYSGTGGIGLDYTMQPTPGWAGTGSGGYENTPIGTLQNLLYVNQVKQNIPVLGVVTILFAPEFWGAIFKILTWQWSFMMNPDGTWAYGLFYWIFLFPFVAMGLLCILILALEVIQGFLPW